MVVLEAMAAGVPIVASRVDGVTDALGHDGAGVLVPPGNPQELAQAIAAVLRGTTDWYALRQTAHRRQAERFSDHSMAQGVASVYRRVLDIQGTPDEKQDCYCRA
jgi:glycosyltransferase involved in cell wall biosynthesis